MADHRVTIISIVMMFAAIFSLLIAFILISVNEHSFWVQLSQDGITRAFLFFGIILGISGLSIRLGQKALESQTRKQRTRRRYEP